MEILLHITYVSEPSSALLSLDICFADKEQRMGMMALLGQHGQRQDIQRGLDMIRFSADNADENAPQGAYVRQPVFTRWDTRLMTR